MNNQSHTNCPVCGAPIPEDAPAGLCPKCVLEGAETMEVATNKVVRGVPPATIEELAPHFPDLEIVELLGAGGMGAVYKARQPQLDRFVALKVLSRDFAGDPAFVERFNREAKVLARLSHPNIVGVFDFGTAGSHCYLLMEYVDGVNLRQAMRTGGFTPTEALALVEEICSALKFAHEEGILHRDIKPENILIDSKGRVKIADFGIAKLVGDKTQHDVTLTMQGSVLGSPHYMAPEQFETPGDVDQRADIYSLGVVLYEMLTGELPIGRFAVPSQKAAMDARIDEIVLRTLEKEREARFQSAEEVRTSVSSIAQMPQAPTVQPSGESGSARFSLASALFTGISLVLVPLFSWFYVEVVSEVYSSTAGDAGRMANSISNKLPQMILVAGMILVGAGTAITGFILGAVALGQVRKSRGQKDGLGLAVFAVVPWPIVLSAVLLSLTLAEPMPGSASSFGFRLIMPFLGCTFLLASYLFIRGLIRWGGGVKKAGEEEKTFPSFGRSLLPAIVCFLVGPVLLVGASIVLPAGSDSDPEWERAAEAEFLRDINEAGIGSTEYDTFGDLEHERWRLRKPEVTLPFVVSPGQRLSLKLEIRRGVNILWSDDLGDLVANKNDAPQKEYLKVGTFLRSDDQKGAIHALRAVKTGRSGHTLHSTQDLRGWTFAQDLPEDWRYEGPIIELIRLATSNPAGTSQAQEELVLEVTVTEVD